MSGSGEAIYQNGKADGMVQGIIVCMNANNCSVEEALGRIGYDRAEWPDHIKAVDARLAREGAEGGLTMA